MRLPIALALGVGVLIIADNRSRHGRLTLRDRAVEAQRISAVASQLARDLATEASSALTRDQVITERIVKR